jgi:hypothetical protein
MALKIAQSASPIDEAYWDWSVWIEGTGDELDGVKEVTWKLHPTFSEPIRRVSSRNTKFKLRASGWGEFTVYATVDMKNNRSTYLEHRLTLAQSDEVDKVGAPKKAPPLGAKEERPSVFLSYSLNNADLAAHLARELEKNAYIVVRDVDIPAGVELRLWSQDQIRKSRAVVVLGADESAAARSLDVQLASSNDVPIIPVTLRRSPVKKGDVSPMLGKIKALHVAGDRPTAIARTLAAMIDDLLKRDFAQ